MHWKGCCIGRAILTQPVDDDGVTFDIAALEAAPIREDLEYGGVRVRTQATIAGARIPIQVDVGFGDAITPGPVEIDYPALLDAPAPHLRAYPIETVVAEKFDALAARGITNSRLKDYYHSEALRGGWSVRQLHRWTASFTSAPPYRARRRVFCLKDLRPRLAISRLRMKKSVIRWYSNFSGYATNIRRAIWKTHSSVTWRRSLLELGNDFAFVGRQRRLRIDDEWYRVTAPRHHGESRLSSSCCWRHS
jgi:predicted nuclease of restriction endonuclease-like (RecB) superfamily